MYRPTAILVASLTFVSGCCALGQPSIVTTLAYDTVYDDRTLSLSQVACSNGVNGLETRGYTKLGELSNFPFIGGVYTVSGWDSTECGTCYAITYENAKLYILAVDVSQIGFTVSQKAMDTLTGGQAVSLGRVNVSSVLVSPSECNLPTLD